MIFPYFRLESSPNQWTRGSPLLHTFIQARSRSRARRLFWREAFSDPATPASSPQKFRRDIHNFDENADKPNSRLTFFTATMPPSLPQFSVARMRSYVFRLPLLTRSVIFIIILFWILSIQSVWDVQQWGALIPKEVGLSTRLSSPLQSCLSQHEEADKTYSVQCTGRTLSLLSMLASSTHS